MNKESFAAYISGLTIGTLARKALYATFDDEQKKAYDEKAKSLAIEFRSKNSNGFEVLYPIDNISITNDGRVAVVCHPAKAPTKNTVFQYATSYVANMARKAGVANIPVLQSVHASSLDDNFLRTTFTVAVKGEVFTNPSTGETGTYEMTTLRNTSDTIVLGEDAKSMLRVVAMDLLKESMRPASPRRVSSNVVTDVEHNEPVSAEEAL